MRKGPAIVALATALLVVGGAASASVPAKNKLPKDACVLLTDDQVAPLVPSLTSEPTEGSPYEVGCHWEDGREVPESLNTLTVSISKLPVPASQIKTSFKVEAKDDGVKPIKGLGDFAFQASVIPPNSEVKVLKGKLVISVEFSGGSAVTDDQVAQTLALAKTVVKKV